MYMYMYIYELSNWSEMGALSLKVSRELQVWLQKIAEYQLKPLLTGKI